MTDKSPVINIDKVETISAGNDKGFEPKLGRIGGLIGMEKLGCMFNAVPEGKAAFPAHVRHTNEEFYVILEGEGTYRLGDKTYPVMPGDQVSAPAGVIETAHQMKNTGKGELKYLCVSTRNDPDVVESPDSNKFLVASMV
jgi:uncharacterized cupin superfamily protein